MKVKFKRLPNFPLDTQGEAYPLTYGSEGAAGLDLRANIPEGSLTLEANSASVLIETGLAVHIKDPNHCAVILPRSGLGHKGLVLGNLVGLIDSDYQGELKISLWNRSHAPQTIKHGDRIAQLVFLPVVRPELVEVETFEEVTERGEEGFNSTGVE
ncbi:MAG: dUTP diphosphatase [Shewanella sp.]